MSYEILNKSVVKPGGQKVAERDIPRKSRIVYTLMPSDYIDISKIDNIVPSTDYKGTFQYRNLETEARLTTGTKYDVIIWTSTKDIFKLVAGNKMITVPTMKSPSKDRFSYILKTLHMMVAKCPFTESMIDQEIGYQNILMFRFNQ